MISINTIQAEIITYLKSRTAITNVVTSAEIREDQWNGTGFIYPNLRVAMLPNRPMAERNCTGNIFDVSIFVNTETSNSKLADDIAAVVATELHEQSFTQGAYKFTGLIVTQLVPAVADATKKVWTAQVQIRGTIN